MGTLLLLAASPLSTSVAGQTAQPEPTFRSGTRTVPVYVTVTDADARLVPDLGREDFTILDNGKPQAIAVFSSETQPISVVMMLDRSGSMVGNFRLVQQAAEQFVTKLLPADLARIGSFSNRVQVDPRTFTNSQEQLLTILHQDLQEPGPTPLWNAVSVGMTALLHQNGRRVVLAFSDGMDRPGIDRPTNMKLGDVVERAREENVMVYAIGLASAARMGPMGRGGGYGGGGYGPGGYGGGGRSGMSDKPDPGLAKLAAESGGGYFELDDTADLSATFARVAEELHRQYALGFTPEKLDGKTHKLEVRVNRPGMAARARRSYVATPGR
ncbi:MAG: VWA domain-containing protein [Acidobacteria bacterium]|nr:VWA domain-containing protein [Acidobacteriota bacterium]